MPQDDEKWLHTAPVILFCFDDQRTITYVNDHFCTELHFQRDSLVGKTLDVFFPVAAQIFYHTHLFPLLKLTGEVREVFVYLKDGQNKQLPFLFNAKRVTADSGYINVCSGVIARQRAQFEQQLIDARNSMEKALADNTHLNAARQELKENMQQLEVSLARLQTQHFELAQLNKAVTHELQEPLRKIHFYTDLLRTGGTPGIDRNATHLAKISDAAKRLAAVLNGLQDFVWLSDSAIEAVPVAVLPLLEEVRKAPGISNGQVKLHVPEGCAVLGDRQLLRRLFAHAIAVALSDASDEKIFPVRVTCAAVQRNIYRQLPNAYEFRAFWKISVVPSGKRWHEGEAAELLQLFPKLHGSAPVQGLALSKKIADYHGGLLEVETSPDADASITIFLPQAEA
jgi:sigma-B regulation protein RsbU (phosphoserine phosphatase)